LLSNLICDFFLNFAPACKTLHEVQFTYVGELLSSHNENVSKSVHSSCHFWLIFSVEWTFSLRIWTELRRASALMSRGMPGCPSVCHCVTHRNARVLWSQK